MSLEEKLDKPGRDSDNGLYTKIERAFDAIDGKYLQFHEWLAGQWQNRTYEPKRILEAVMYTASFFGWGSMYGQTHHPVYFFVAGVVGAGAVACSMYPKTKKNDDKIRNQFYKNKTYKAVLSVSYSLSILGMAMGLGELFYPEKIPYPDAITDITWSIAAISTLSATYLGRVSVDDPPKRPKKKSLTERMKEALKQLSPPPALQPMGAGP